MFAHLLSVTPVVIAVIALLLIAGELRAIRSLLQERVREHT